MSYKKKFLKHPRTQRVLGVLIAGYIKLVFLTSRKTYHIHPHAAGSMRGDNNAIFAFWHGRMLMLPTFSPPQRKMYVLSSLHGDGKLSTYVLKYFKQGTVGGSSSRGGGRALQEIRRLLAAGENISITPDGPRGPALTVSPGIVAIARVTGKVIVPIVFSSNRERYLSTWDSFAVALPFGYVHFYAGKPIAATRSSDKEDVRRELEQAMHASLAEADEAARA